MHKKDTKEGSSKGLTGCIPSLKVKRLQAIFERYHLANPYNFSGPVIRFPFHQNGRSIDQVVSEMNSDFERKKFSLYATAPSDYGAIDVQTRDGPGLDIIREYRMAQPDASDQVITQNRKYCSQ